jgi:hypothetical protein
MNSQKVTNGHHRIQYEHLKDYPTSTEGFSEISNRAVAAALCCEHMPDVLEASPEQRSQIAAQRRSGGA